MSLGISGDFERQSGVAKINLDIRQPFDRFWFTIQGEDDDGRVVIMEKSLHKEQILVGGRVLIDTSVSPLWRSRWQASGGQPYHSYWATVKAEHYSPCRRVITEEFETRLRD